MRTEHSVNIGMGRLMQRIGGAQSLENTGILGFFDGFSVARARINDGGVQGSQLVMFNRSLLI